MLIGQALVISNDKFALHEERKAGDVDCHKVNQLLRKLGFAVTTVKDGTAEEVQQAVHTMTTTDHLDLFVCVVMSHGVEIDDDLHFITSDDWHLSVRYDVREKLCCPALQNTFKLFVINCCRTVATKEIPNRHVRVPTRLAIHPALTAHSLVVYSAQDKSTSYRCPESGSLFLAPFVHLLNEGRQKDLARILTETNAALVSHLDASLHQASNIESNDVRGQVFFAPNVRHLSCHSLKCSSC